MPQNGEALAGFKEWAGIRLQPWKTRLLGSYSTTMIVALGVRLKESSSLCLDALFQATAALVVRIFNVHVFQHLSGSPRTGTL